MLYANCAHASSRTSVVARSSEDAGERGGEAGGRHGVPPHHTCTGGMRTEHSACFVCGALMGLGCASPGSIPHNFKSIGILTQLLSAFSLLCAFAWHGRPMCIPWLIPYGPELLGALTLLSSIFFLLSCVAELPPCMCRGAYSQHLHVSRTTHPAPANCSALQGTRGLFRGMSSPLVGSLVFNSILFGCFEEFKRLLSPAGQPATPLVFATSAALTGVVESTVYGPTELIKTRMQTMGPNSKVCTLSAAGLKSDNGVYCRWYMLMLMSSLEYAERMLPRPCGVDS